MGKNIGGQGLKRVRVRRKSIALTTGANATLNNNNINFPPQGTNDLKNNKLLRSNSMPHIPPPVTPNFNLQGNRASDDGSIESLLNKEQRKQLMPDPRGEKDNDTGVDDKSALTPPPPYNEVTRNFRVADNGDIILPRQDTPQSAIPLHITPQITKEYQQLFSRDSRELTPSPNATISRIRTKNEVLVDSYVNKDKVRGIEVITYSNTISLRVSELENQIAASQNKVEKIINIYELRNKDKKAQKNSLSAIKYDTDSVNQILTLSNFKQSLATNQIMLIFQQQAKLLQAQVDHKEDAYVQYNSEEKKLIAKIQQEATALYEKGLKLDKLVAEGANQKRADKLENSALLDTKFKGLTSDLRKRDKGLKLDEVNPHYKLKDLKVILKQFQQANKEMNGLLKMPDLSKRCGLLASLYDGASTLAKKAVFLVPQTAVAAVAIVEYGIATVLYDTVKQGLTSAKNAFNDVWEKRNVYIEAKILQRNSRIFKSINKNREEARKFVQDFTTKADAIIAELPDNNENQNIRETYTALKNNAVQNSKNLLLILSLLENNKLDTKNLPKTKKLDNLEKQFEKLDAQLDKAKAGLFPRLASAILGVPAAVLWGGIAGAAKTVAAGAKNATVNVPEGVKGNYKLKATEKVTLDENNYAIKNKAWNKAISTIHTPDKEARNIAYKKKVDAAEAKKILANEITPQKTRSSEFKLPESEAKGGFVSQDGKMNLGEYIAQTQANIQTQASKIQYIINIINSERSALTQNAQMSESDINKRLQNWDSILVSIDDVLELTKLQQQNAVSNIMLAFLGHAEYIGQQVYADKSQEQKLNEEIQDLMQNLAARAAQLEDKIDKEINSKRADRLAKNDLVSQLTKSLNSKNITGQDTYDAVMEGNYDLNDLKRIKKVLEKANNYMDGLLKMPDVSKRCGLLASLYDLTTTLAKSAVFLVPKTAAAAVSIVQYAVMTVVVDTIKQGWTSGKNAGNDVLEKRNEFVTRKMLERNNRISESINKNREEAFSSTNKFKDIVEKKLKNNGTQEDAFNKLINDQKSLPPYKQVKEILEFCRVNSISLDGVTIPNVELLKRLQKQFEKLDAQLEKVASAPIISFATAILGVPAAVLWGGLSGVGKTIVAGVKNVTFNASEDKQLGTRWKTHTTDQDGKKKSWARNFDEISKYDRAVRDASHKDKAERGAATAKILAERAKDKGKSGEIGH